MPSVADVKEEERPELALAIRMCFEVLVVFSKILFCFCFILTWDEWGGRDFLKPD